MSMSTEEPSSPNTGSETPSTTTKPKRARTSRPKVKTGCSNCKQRRIKCDEKRPACTQCVRSNRSCVGYPAPSRSARPYEELRIAPRPLLASNAQPVQCLTPFQREVVLPPRRSRQRNQRAIVTRTPSPTTYQPSLSLSLQPLESMYFEIFRGQTAAELSGYFDSTFWTRRVLQECHTETAIKHAVIALGALYKTLEHSAESPRQSPSAGDHTDAVVGHWKVAIYRYSEACNAMVHINGQDPKSRKTILMASVLLTCFDSFIGDHKQAIKQVQTGLGLLERLREDQKQQLSSLSEDALEQDLNTMFARLAIQAKSYDMAFHFPEPYVVRLREYSPSTSSSSGSASSASGSCRFIPDCFQSLLEARVASDRVTENTLRFMDAMFDAAQDGKGFLPQSWMKHGLEYQAQLEAWSNAFEPIFHSRTSGAISSQEKAGIAAIKMFNLNSQILMTMLFSGDEDHFDAFLPQFQMIVSLGQEIIADAEARAVRERCPNPDHCTCPYQYCAMTGSRVPASHIKPSFSADLGIVPPLFVVATKCRDPITRRQAIQLLRSSARREGMWDSELVAHLSTWVMKLEESQDQFLDPQLLDASVASGPGASPFFPATPPGMLQAASIVPSDKRVRIRSVNFDLRARYADIEVGTRGASPGMPDERYRQTRITW